MPTTRKPRKLATYSKSRPLTVTVKRKRWLRGEDESALLWEAGHNANRMCCLGFACRQIGLTRRDILGIGAPCDTPLGVIPGLSKRVKDGCTENTATCSSLMDANDSQDITEETREETIVKLGKRVGLRFVFEG